jgi:sporulation protein YlmC with PRC-barrel domain
MKYFILIIATILPTLGIQARETRQTHDLEFRPAVPFRELIGAEVRNYQDEKLGRIATITADLSNGRLVEVVVVGRGGLFGIGAKAKAVPPRALTIDKASRVVRLDVSRAKFDAAPKFDPASRPEKVAEYYRYFGLKPWFFLKGETVQANAEILELGYVQTTKRLVGMPISNHDGDYLGRIEGLVMDLPLGRVVHVIVKTEADSSPRRVIQPRALKFNAAKTMLVLDNNYVELDGEPHFKWTDGRRTDFNQETYVNREVKADRGLHSKQNLSEGLAPVATLMEQGKNFRDVQKTAKIQRAIQADPKLSANAKDIEVVTLNAQTTLRGHVNTPEGKQRIGEIAEQAGRPENVSNLIEVRPISATPR